jgi:outer membrane protein assembly factor BamA
MWAAVLVLLLAPVRGAESPALHPRAVAPAFQAGEQSETVATIQIQGNTATPDEEILKLAGVSVGMPFEAATVEATAERLRASKRFERVEVRKRFASIADPSQIALVIVVDEGPVKIVMTGDPDHPTRVARKRMPNLQFFPILGYEDGYGMTYGLRTTIPDPNLLGKRSRITFPVSWGGTRQAGIDLEKRIEGGVIDRITGGASVSRRINQAFQQEDERARLYVRGEHEFARTLRLGVGTGWQRATFEGVTDTFAQTGGDVTLDTRVDPVLARNAVYARASIEQLRFGSAPANDGHYDGTVNRTVLDGRGYLGLIGQSVLAGRILREDSDRPLPDYLKPQLGGLSTLRGFRTGAAIGDTLLTSSAELVVPLTSPIKIAKFGVTGFVDHGTIYNKGEELSDSTWLTGYGGSVWFAAAFFRLNVAIAHGHGADTRVHVGGNVTF